MRQLTSSFNLQDSNIALTPSVTSDDGVAVEHTDPPVPPSPDDPGNDGFSTWAILGFIALGLLLLFILVCAVHYCYD